MAKEKKNDTTAENAEPKESATLPMRTLRDHKIEHPDRPEPITIGVLDEPGSGGASHLYRILVDPTTEEDLENGEIRELIATDIHFQKGGIAEVGVNGLTQEALLAIVIDRLRSFQEGPYPCEENQIALDHCERALNTLHKRTWDRIDREVEGKEEA